jgi:hypothetical protein
MSEPKVNYSTLTKTEMIFKIRNKMIVSIIEICHLNGYEHAHPSQLNIRIPLGEFENDEIEFLRINQHSFKFCDMAVDKDYHYPCYEIEGDYLCTNVINLTSFR